MLVLQNTPGYWVLYTTLILSFSFTNRYFIAWIADYTDHMYLTITIGRKITLKDTFFGVRSCKLIVPLITVYIN